MENAAFWTLIDRSRLAADGDPDAQIESLTELVSELEPDEIVEFDRIMGHYHDRAYSWDLWGAAYIIGGGCSDDGFMDFRGWLISKGEQVFEAALRDPESLAEAVTDDDGDCQVEGYLYIPLKVWEEKTGRSSDEFPDQPSKGRRVPVGTEWEEDDLETRFPKLCEKFGF